MSSLMEGRAVINSRWAPCCAGVARPEGVSEVGNHLLLRDHVFIALDEHIADMLRNCASDENMFPECRDQKGTYGFEQWLRR